ncbi:MAG TPA: ribosome small subunit-dependent GTPase A [Dermatophilaceae bacterium]|nr:ribosome small subunit-dependent GTPase A [Dermatophilaceae bacterium]
MIRRARVYDESDARIRPNPKGSRPRTKDRPTHLDAVVGTVLGVDRGRYPVAVDGRIVTAMKAREIGRRGVVVGDRVGVVGDVTGQPGSLARIVRIEPRRSVLRRSADDVDPVERVIVANADQLAIVTAVADPPPRTRMIDRCLVAAYDAGMQPLLVLTKADLADPEPLYRIYADLGVPCVVTSFQPCTGTIAGLVGLTERLQSQVSVLIGHSGVGKSTLVNALVPGAYRAIGEVNEVTGRGRHTSTSAVALALPGDRPPPTGEAGALGYAGDGWIIDTPGIRSFGLAHIRPDRFVTHFPELTNGLDQCPRGCSHDEPDCGLDDWVASGHAGPSGRARLNSLRRLLRSRAGGQED